MKTWFLLLSLCLPAAAQDAPLEVFRVPNFNCGVVTRYSPILIGDNCVQDARNVYFDEQGVSRRKGYAQFNSAPFTDLKSVRMVAPFTSDDGTRYIVALSSKTLYSAPTTGVFTAISGMPNFSDIADMDAVAYLGKIWFANGVDSMAYWTGAATATVTEAPLGGMIEGWRNRIVTAGVAGSLSYVYMSQELDGEEWTTGPTTSIAPVAIAFGGINAKPIRCVYGGFKDFLFVANEDETYGVYGFGRNDFVVRTISREVGCIEDKSVQEKDGALYWMSRSGIEKMTTQGGIQRISDGVKDVFDELISNTAVNRTKLYTTQAHWEVGNLTASGAGAPISATISPGSLVPSTWSHTDTDGADWAAGTLNNVSTSATAVSISPNISSVTLLDNFTDSTVSPWVANVGPWNATYQRLTAECSAGVLCSVYISTATSAYGLWTFTLYQPKDCGDSLVFVSNTSDPLTTSGYALEAFPGVGSTSVNLQKVENGSYINIGTTSLTNPNGSTRSFKILRGDKGNFSVWYSTGRNRDGDGDGSPWTLIISTTDNTYSSSNFLIFKGVKPAGNSGLVLDDVWVPLGYSSGTFISQIFTLPFSTPVAGPFSFTDSVPVGSTIAYSVRGSTYSAGVSAASWSVVSTTTSGAYRMAPLDGSQYWQYKADFSTQYSTQTPQLNDVTLQAATTGEYIHECAQIDSISSWGNFQANSVLDGGSISYFVSTGTTCDSVQKTTANWTAQANNSPITISTAAYLGIKELFTIDAATQTALLRDVTIDWLEGTARPPVASSVYLNRYYLAYTTSTAGNTNDFMFVADKNDAVTFLDNMNCYSLGLFNRKMFCGDATATGKIYQMETGESDDGEAFTSYVRTKAYHFGDPDAEKEFVKMYAAFAPEAEQILDINITPAYSLDLSTSVIALNPVNTGEDSTAGMLVAKIPFAVSNNLTGRFLDVKFSNTSNTGGWTMFGLSFYLRRYDVK